MTLDPVLFFFNGSPPAVLLIVSSWGEIFMPFVYFSSLALACLLFFSSPANCLVAIYHI